MAIECEHGRLARKCDTCEDAREIAELRAERDALQRRLDALAARGPTPDEIAALREHITGSPLGWDDLSSEAWIIVRDALLTGTAQEPPAVPPGEWTPERVAAFNAPHHCLACGREVGPATGRHECGPRRASEPVLSPADVLSGAEEMLRRIAATACLDLDATEAGAIVAELDRLRALCDEVSAQNTMVRHERDEARRERDAAETRSADVDDRLVEYGWSAERAAVCAYLRADGSHLTADALERGEHIVKEKA